MESPSLHIFKNRLDTLDWDGLAKEDLESVLNLLFCDSVFLRGAVKNIMTVQYHFYTARYSFILQQ